MSLLGTFVALRLDKFVDPPLPHQLEGISEQTPISAQFNWSEVNDLRDDKDPMKIMGKKRTDAAVKRWLRTQHTKWMLLEPSKKPRNKRQKTVCTIGTC